MAMERVPARVLVVDDDHVVADTLVLILKNRGFDCRAVYSGEEAVELVQTWPPEFVISDILMGKMDGVALASFLAQSLPACKVLLITALLSAVEYLEPAKQQGYSFPVLSKPAAPDAILEFLASSDAVKVRE